MPQRTAKRTRLLGRASSIVTALLAACVSPAWAHGLIDHYLQHTQLCLDQHSAQVYARELPLAVEALEAELKAVVHATLESLQVPLVRATSCQASDSYVLVVAEVVPMRSLPGELAFSFELQVGRHAEREDVARYYELPTLRFHEFVTGRVGDEPFGHQMVRQAREASRTLAAAWWEDNPPRAEPPLATALYLLAGAAAGLGGYLALQALVMRWREPAKGKARP